MRERKYLHNKREKDQQSKIKNNWMTELERLTKNVKLNTNKSLDESKKHRRAET